MSIPNSGKNTATLQQNNFPNSEKIYVAGELHPEIRVPMRQVSLTNGEKINLYDTSGPFSDNEQQIDIFKGINKIREDWINQRDDTESYEPTPLAYPSKTSGKQKADIVYLQNKNNFNHAPRKALTNKTVTQMHYAKQGIITPEMEFVAIRENHRRALLKLFLFCK